LAARRQRNEAFGDDLFADPAWDILLDLFVSQAEDVGISVSSACLAAGVASTTALGHLVKLEKRGLVLRQGDPSDRRRTFLRLSPSTTVAIEQWLTETFAIATPEDGMCLPHC
jgi:DNA-binding MarR family transcriptional regulator